MSDEIIKGQIINTMVENLEDAKKLGKEMEQQQTNPELKKETKSPSSPEKESTK